MPGATALMSTWSHGRFDDCAVMPGPSPRIARLWALGCQQLAVELLWLFAAGGGCPPMETTSLPQTPLPLMGKAALTGWPGLALRVTCGGRPGPLRRMTSAVPGGMPLIVHER